VFVLDTDNSVILDQKLTDVGTLKKGRPRVPGAHGERLVKMSALNLNCLRIAAGTLIFEWEPKVESEVERELGAELVDVALVKHTIQDIQLTQSNHARRKQRLPTMESWEFAPFEQQHGPAKLGEPPGGHGAAGSRADDDDVDGVGGLHALTSHCLSS
jgi:hypothetical protein